MMDAFYFFEAVTNLSYDSSVFRLRGLGNSKTLYGTRVKETIFDYRLKKLV